MTAFFTWMSKVLSESAEPFAPSLSRLLTLLFGLAAIGWVSNLIYASKALPSLFELAGFVTSPYLVNKTSATISDFRNGGALMLVVTEVTVVIAYCIAMNGLPLFFRVAVPSKHVAVTGASD